jgi:hypothetical protein
VARGVERLALDGPPSRISSTLDAGLEIAEHGRQRAGPQPADFGLEAGSRAVKLDSQMIWALLPAGSTAKRSRLSATGKPPSMV